MLRTVLFTLTALFLWSPLVLAQTVEIRMMEKCQAENGVWNSATKSCDPIEPITNFQQSVNDPQEQSRSNTGWGQACASEAAKAVADCQFENNSGVQVAKLTIDMLNQRLKQNAMSSPAALCGQMGNATQAIDAASGAFNGYCTASFMSCQQTCDSEIEQIEAAMTTNTATEIDLKAAKDNRKKCSALAANVQGVQQNIQGYAQIEQAKSLYCKEQVDPMTALCKANPNLAGCKDVASTNCADPQVAATSMICYCNTNPNDPRCPTANQNHNFNNKLSADATGLGTPPGDDGAGDFGGVGAGPGSGFLPEMNGQPGQPAKGNLNRGSSGRSGLGMGGGGTGQAPGRGGAGGGGSGLNTQTISGYGYGGGMGGGYGSGSRSGNTGNRVGGPSGSIRGGAPAVDLKQFMPGGKMDPSRALAGVSGPDGITGPHSNIWKKIRVRYFSVRPSLLP